MGLKVCITIYQNFATWVLLMYKLTYPTSIPSFLTLSPLLISIVPYANSLHPDETPIKLGVSPAYKLFDTQTTFSLTLSNAEAL